MFLENLVGNVDREFCIVKALDGAERRPSGLNCWFHVLSQNNFFFRATLCLITRISQKIKHYLRNEKKFRIKLSFLR